MSEQDSRVEVSAIIPVSERHDDTRSLYFDYKEALDQTGLAYETVFVLDGQFPRIAEELKDMRANGERIRVIQLTKSFGEAAALTVGFDNSSGDLLLTLPAYYQASPADISKLFAGLEQNDMVIGRRWPRTDSKLKQLQTRAFHGILHFVADCSFRDLGCGLRLFRRQVVDEIPLYGDQHRFLPVLAEQRGFRVTEIDVAQSERDTAPKVYASGVYLRRILDILTVFFLVKFTKKPLRFFGLIGSSVLAFGGLILLIVIVQRLFFGVGLGDRPALVLSSLFVVLGVQLLALGLIGELIIFTHARDIKEYTIEKILN